MKVPAFTLALLCALYTANLSAEDMQTWRLEGQKALEASKKLAQRGHRAKNIILFVGDGMGVSTVTAARIFEGQQQGRDGERNLLAFEKMPYVAMSKTFSANQQTADSAPTMTAIMTGVKANDGVIALNQHVVKGEKNAAIVEKNSVETLLEMAEKSGFSTGIVTTTRVTHATPAATYAHTSHRDWENNSQIPSNIHIADIASQLIDRFGPGKIGNGLEVVLGGGRAHFLPQQLQGKRSDHRNLITEFQQKFGADYVDSKQALNAINPAKTHHLIGLFDDDHLQYDTDRTRKNSLQPSLAEMVTKAIEVLSTNPNGYFLMVEAGRIDHAHHAGNAYRALADTVALSDAVKHAMAKIDLDDTLVIVTADHSHTMTLSGYAKRGNPILHKVVFSDHAEPALALDQQPYATLNYTNGQGHIGLIPPDEMVDKNIKPQVGRETNLSIIDTEHPDFHQQAMIPLQQETHAGEDVQIFADGPNAHLFHGVQDQTYIFYVMKDALGL